MSIHKLSAGSGYDYLTRQVARHDATQTGRTGLADYYTAQGEAPGVWVGSGLAGIEGLEAGDPVTAEQMRRLFGAGLHPLGDQLVADLAGQPGVTAQEHEQAERLGRPYRVYGGQDVTAFRIEVARRFEAFNRHQGLPADWAVPRDDRSRIRTQVATEFFRAEHGRDPVDAREVAATIAKHSRRKTTAVAGYDLTFSPVKSVSTLWAVADRVTAARIEAAHAAAVRDALAFLETHALFTRTGTNGVRQVDVQGLVATAFTHRDSRAGDPDLHTHVAVANKVQTLDGHWLSVDGRVLFKATVTASETYNTALEHHLGDLGMVFAERPNLDVRKRPVREVAGVDPRLNQRWSARRASIETRRAELAATFQATHGRPPTPVESIQLAQQATLETRETKHEPRSLADQRAQWHAEAVQVLGTPEQVQAMVTTALTGGHKAPGGRVTSEWIAHTAQVMVATVEGSRSTWQVWHVRAEAHRRVRGMDIPTQHLERVVDLLTDHALTARSVSLARPDDNITEPAQLRRCDGASVYTVHGADLYTSTQVLQAERRLVATASRTDGRAASTEAVQVALLEATANGVTLNPGQAALVTSMATSGNRLQLGIAPAGTGKTTALRTLAAAWTASGGDVLGLAPSASAAAVLADHTHTTTDTLAKLTWALTHDDLPDWANNIGRNTLVIVDEAGMADTRTLDTVVTFVTDRGGSVRLVGDDQQLAAIGAGGILRDIETTHGALRLTQLMRFTDPGEGAASLALRDGKPEALGFYLDHGRVHVGDLGTLTDDVFDAWATDRTHGLDAIMLAPTRDLAADLNQRARTHRLDGTVPDQTVRLADGNDACTGDQVITRSNDRRLRTSATDWVKNGDRWTILHLRPDGGAQARHTRTGRVITLPPGYVRAATELGYATTVHTAQGVTADTMHGLATGAESRQQLYTMMTRGRHANHVYLQVVGDGDPHTIIHPTTTHPSTATDLLEGVLARDDSPVSATTTAREMSDPATLLGQATARYVDALYTAAEHHHGPTMTARLDDAAEAIVPGLTDSPAWPTLRAHLLLLSAHDIDPVTALRAAATSRELDTAGDPAAVLGWRLDDTGLRNAGPGPLPWLPAIPTALTSDPTWGKYLTRRATLVADLTTQVRDTTRTNPTPVWAQQGTARPEPGLLADVQVWRAATGVPEHDLRPTGPPRDDKAHVLHQRQLRARLAGDRTPALAEWGPAIETLSPTARRDRFAPVLAERLAGVSRAGIDAAALLRRAATERDLPDDHAAAALWWRIAYHLTPAVAAEVDKPRALTTDWWPTLADTIGVDRAQVIRDSSWWPPLVTAVEHALHRGWTLPDVLGTAPAPGTDVDDAQAMVWAITVMTDPAPHPQPPVPDPADAQPPTDLWDEHNPPSHAPTDAEIYAQRNAHDPGVPDLGVVHADDTPALMTPEDVDAGLALAALTRPTMGVLAPSDAEIERMVARAADWITAPVPRERMVTVNQMALDFYEHQYATTGWARGYLADRFGQDVTGHPHIRPGYAPPGWTHLVDHLHARGVSDVELLETGLATTARTGRLIDRFRDRALFPITHDEQVLGFIGRRDPTLTDQDPHAGPKYLNTPTTLLFHKGDQLYGVMPELLTAGATPVLVEGPMDAHAVTFATGGTHIGLAPLGTALTQTQAAQLARYSRAPIVATDTDPAGHLAAERDHWLLSQHGLTPMMAGFPTGTDPADLLERRGPTALQAALGITQPLAEVLLRDRLNNPNSRAALHDAVTVLATHLPRHWEQHVDAVAGRFDVPTVMVRQALLSAVRTWHQDPRQVATIQIDQSHRLRAHLQSAGAAPPVRPRPTTPKADDTALDMTRSASLHDLGATSGTTRGRPLSR